MNATCDNCNQITKIEFKQAQHPKGIQETYFMCEQCNKRYTCFVTDNKVRGMQKQLQQKGGRQNGRGKLHNDIKERMAKLKYELEST